MKKKGIGVSVGSLVIVMLISVFLFSASHYLQKSKSKLPTGKLIETGTSPYTSQLTVRRSEIEQILRGALVDAIREVEKGGGYLIGEQEGYYPNKSVDFKGMQVPFYRVCGHSNIPSFDEIQNKILKRFYELANYRLMRYAESNPEITYNGLKFNLTILEGKAVLGGNVFMSYKGEPIPGDFYISIPTKLKNIYEFATNFVSFTKSTRLLDYLFIYELYKAKENYFPTRDILTKCGESIHLSNIELSQHFMELYHYFIDNVNMNIPFRSSHTYTLEQDDPLFFAFSDIIDMQNNRLLYDDSLKEVELFAPDDYVVVFPSGVDVVNDEPVLKLVVPIGDKCEKAYDFSYSFPFVYIVGLKDDAISDDAYFYFAEYSKIDDMTPASCDYDDLPDNTHILVPGLETTEEYAAQVRDNINPSESHECNDKQVVVQVVDDEGNPIRGAGVSFGSCGLGTTDNYGKVRGYVSDDEDILRISPPEGYVGYAKKMNLPSYLRVVLPKVREANVNVNFIKVETNLVSPSSDYDYPYAYLDLSASNSVLGPVNAKLEIRKCEVLDSKPPMNVSVTFSLSPIPYSVDMSQQEDILYPGKTYTSTLDVDTGEVNLSTGKYYINVEEDKGYENMVGLFAFDSSKYRKGGRSVQLVPSSLGVVNIPYIVVSNRQGEFSNYLLGEYLNIPRIAVAKYTNQQALDRFSHELADFVFNSCGIDPFSPPAYQKYYAVRNCKGWVYAARDCGVQNVDQYYNNYVDPETNEEVWECNYNALRDAMHNLGCEINEVNTP